jgi:hypothetical protein
MSPEVQGQLLELRAVVHQLAAALADHLNGPLDHVYRGSVSPADRVHQLANEMEAMRRMLDGYSSFTKEPDA